MACRVRPLVSGKSMNNNTKNKTDSASSVVNPFGESHDVTSLFVADASILSSEVTVGPHTTVCALAKYIARSMLDYERGHFVATR